MAKIEDCPGFETFGADVKAARNAKHLSRRALAEIIDIDSRYLANIENEDTIPALPVIIAYRTYSDSFRTPRPTVIGGENFCGTKHIVEIVHRLSLSRNSLQHLSV